MTQKGYTHTHMKTWDSQDFSIGPSPLKSRFTQKNGSPTWRIYVYSLCHAMWCSPIHSRWCCPNIFWEKIHSCLKRQLQRISSSSLLKSWRWKLIKIHEENNAGEVATTTNLLLFEVVNIPHHLLLPWHKIIIILTIITIVRTKFVTKFKLSSKCCNPWYQILRMKRIYLRYVNKIFEWVGTWTDS